MGDGCYLTNIIMYEKNKDVHKDFLKILKYLII